MSHRHRFRPFHAPLLLVVVIAACGGGGAEEAVVFDADGCVTGVQPVPGASAFCRGKANFSDRTLTGLGANGRSCADCHVPEESFQLRPANAQARRATMLATGADDPLFRAIDADDFRVNGAAAHDTLQNQALSALRNHAATAFPIRPTLLCI